MGEPVIHCSFCDKSQHEGRTQRPTLRPRLVAALSGAGLGPLRVLLACLAGFSPMRSSTASSRGIPFTESENPAIA